MLDGRGQVRITDFGLARSLGERRRRGRGRGHAGLHGARATRPRRDERPERPVLAGAGPLRGLHRPEGVRIRLARRADAGPRGVVRRATLVARRRHGPRRGAGHPPVPGEGPAGPAPSRPAPWRRPCRAATRWRRPWRRARRRRRAWSPPPAGLGQIPPAVAVACLAGVAIGLLVVSLLAQRTMLVNRAPMELPPDALEVKAKEIIKRLGYTGPPAYSARGFEDAPADREAIKQAKLPPGVTDRWDLLRTGPWPGLRFWYRQSPEPMVVNEFWDERGQFSRSQGGFSAPALDRAGHGGREARSPGEAAVVPAVPPARRPADPSRSQEGTKLRRPGPSNRQRPPIRATCLGLRGSAKRNSAFSLEASSEKGRNPRRLSGDELREADWLRTPPDAYDHLAAWKGTWPDSDAPLYVEAAAYRVDRSTSRSFRRPSRKRKRLRARLDRRSTRPL